MSELPPLKILFVGNREGDAQQFSWLISNIKKPVMEIMSVPDADALLNQRSNAGADAILLDLDSTGDSDFETLKALRATFSTTPVVVLTESEDEDGQLAIRNGAQDFIGRGQLTAASLARSLVSSIERQKGQQSTQENSPLLESATAVLNRLPMGVILVTATSQVLFMNGKAKNYLDQGDGLKVDQNRICRAALSSENKQLSNLLQSVLNQESEEATDGEFAMSVTREQKDTPLTVMVAPIGTGIAGKGAVLFVSDPSEPVELSIDAICGLYGLTPAEGRLALGLTNGYKLDDLAEEWNVSMHTVRSQLRQIFRKTDTSRQSELVKLILTGPAALKATPIL
ncbi:hypothetical protein GUA87_14750 [Sneathiella sp. P13V-1]|uniref:DNA-binding response regulator n=1 Tax=Sneathiella sp. P13V-1 TaxID=2697366 RepID=UPI00187BB192|nr:DNA-binding response regulator [Sneathiella sp. P13V-1]MBE7638114.1 hypothetical protein [Sneathiella sp. P13V-1]